MNYKFVLLPAKKRAKGLVALSLMAIALSVIIVACQKTADASLPVSQSSFNPAYVKEWYYGTFKKSAEWASSNTKTKKLPDWNHPTVGKIGDFEAIEYPLVKAISAFSIAGGATTSPDVMRKIANASLSKIVFIKDKNNKVQVREIDYIPDWEYLQKKGFDISDVSMVKDKKGFSGRIRINKWDGFPLHSAVMESGKTVKISDPYKKTGREVIASAAEDNCTEFEICTFERECSYNMIGDSPSSLVCGEWVNTGVCWTEYYCGGNSDECTLYGINCAGTEGDDCSQSNPADVLKNGVVDDGPARTESTTAETTAPNGEITRTRYYSWQFYTGRFLHLKWHYISKSTGVHIKINNSWQWKSWTHNSIATTGSTIGETTCEMNNSWTDFTNNNTIATLNLDFTVKVTMYCFGVPIGTAHQNYPICPKTKHVDSID
jgi:hypothetical protein